MNPFAPVTRVTRAPLDSNWKSPVVRSFWKSVGGRSPKDSVCRVCDDLTKQLNRSKPPFQSDRYEYAELLGIEVVEKPISNQKLQGILSVCGTEYLILLNENASAEQKNFTVCHEVGHIKMLQIAESTLGPERVLNHLTGSKEEERLSNAFAENLLMPRKQFREAAEGLNPSMQSVVALAGKFRTSVEATALRIVSLNIWSCLLFWCAPRREYGGGWVVEIKGSIRAASVANPPVSGRRLVRWGVDGVFDAYHNKRLTSTAVIFRDPGLNNVEQWRLDCLNHKDSVLALMVRGEYS